MRKFCLAIASCVALVAFMGLSGTAFGLADPRCEADGNPTEILDFSIDTPYTGLAYKVSSFEWGAYFCGSEIFDDFDGATLYNHFDMRIPLGVDIADSGLVPRYSDAGIGVMNALYEDYSLAWFTENVDTYVMTDEKYVCRSELRNRIVGWTPGNEPGSEIVSCLMASNYIGANMIWVVRDADGGLWLTFGPMYGYGEGTSFTYLKLQFCAYYGDPSVVGVECGSEENGDQWQQRNGSSCWNKQTYSVRATMENGTVTPWAYTKVRWRGKYKPFPQIREYCPPRYRIDLPY